MAGSLQLSMTSTGVGANANTVNVSNTNANDFLFDVGAANTLVLTNSSPGSLVITGNSSNQVTVNFAAGGSISSLTLAGGRGQDDFTLGDVNGSSNPLNTATDFGVNIDSASVSSGNIFDSLNIIGEVSTAGAGNFQTSNSTTSNQNLGQIDIAPTGSFLALGGNVVLTANAQAGSSITISTGAVVQTGIGSIDLTADNSVSPLGKIFLAGSPLATNGGSLNINSGLVLSDNTTLNTGAASTGNITFQSTVDGNGLPPAENLTLQTAGVITFNGNIGTSSALGDLIINSQNPTSLKLTGNISANSFQTASAVNGTIEIVGTQNYLTTTGVQLKTAGASGDVTFNGNITFTNTATNVSVAHSGSLLIAGNIGKIDNKNNVFLGALFNETNVTVSGPLTSVSFPTGQSGSNYQVNDLVIISSSSSTSN
ncbi:MAG: beta strand repeat-containing protein, partial [Gemmataceae bacterium]